jgi:hypothetical protein
MKAILNLAKLDLNLELKISSLSDNEGAKPITLYAVQGSE